MAKDVLTHVGVERKAEQSLASKLREIGSSPAIDRFLRKYGNVRTKATYAVELALYLRWLKGRGVGLSPYGLVEDNLLCVYESKPTDVSTKRRHIDLLSEYINGYLVENDYSEQKRACAASATEAVQIERLVPFLQEQAYIQRSRPTGMNRGLVLGLVFLSSFLAFSGMSGPEPSQAVGMAFSVTCAQARFYGSPGLQAHFTNELPWNESVNVFFAWYNSANQLTSLDAELNILFAPGQNASFSYANMVTGAYYVKTFALDLEGNSLSVACGAPVTVP